jgi:NAD-dependent dihydropyrimidine dehydrogenase PreA subunit
VPTITIEKAGCRECSLCQEVCPVDVFDRDPAEQVAVATRVGDCIECLSCEYICPSRCLTVGDVVRQRPLYRVGRDALLVSKMLGVLPLAETVSLAEIESATTDVTVRLTALADSVTQTMGRGQKVVGRQAGQLAAEHLPEMYESRDLEEVMVRLRRRFAGSFEFVAEIAEDGSEIRVDFSRCALSTVVRGAEREEGSATVCLLFHEYWAGLIGAFVGRTYAVQQGDPGRTCSILLRARS